ncbi:hypothetical protein ACFL0H_11285 [Thermodesulfobacteriota bacterium]
MIDVFAHILPVKFKKALLKTLPSNFSWKALDNPVLSDPEGRFEIMDGFEGLSQVLSLPLPPVEYIKMSYCRYGYTDCFCPDVYLPLFWRGTDAVRDRHAFWCQVRPLVGVLH